MKNFFVICTFLFTSVLFAQKIELKGKVVYPDKKPIEGATVYISAQKDSTLIDYTITDISGNFAMPLRTVETPSFLTVSYIGYEDFFKNIDAVKESIDFGTIELRLDDNILDELVITTDAAPIRIKQDTLEFNAASFKVRPDATVKELLEQLPGIEVDTEGKIKHNGRDVTNVLVNGKPFFGADGKVIMENLPAEIINKVQITDYKSKEERLTGAGPSGDTKTINLTIDDDKNKGLFGRVVAGYGTDDRYESSLLFNYFKGDLKVSVLSSSNNINSTGFSMDEIFDNMSGGRTRFTSWSGDGSFNMNGLEFGGGQGIYQTDMLGFNYSDKWGKNTDVSGNYLFNEVENNNKSRSRVENLLPDNRYITESESEMKSKSTKHSFNYNIEIKLDSLTTLSIEPKLQRGLSYSRTGRFSETRNEFGELLNQKDDNSYTNADTYSFQNEFLITRRFQRKGRSLSVAFENNNTKNSSEERIDMATHFYQTALPDDIRNQNVENNNHTDQYTLNVTYREPIADKQTLSFTLRNVWTNDYQGRGTYDFEENSGGYSLYNDLLSYSNRLNGSRTTPGIGYQVNGGKIYFTSRAETTINNYDVSSFYNNQSYLNQRVDILPNLTANGRLKLGKSMSTSAGYSYRETSPSMYQLLEYEDLSNPLRITQGNRDLKTTQRHSVNLSFNNYDWQTRSGYNIYVNGTLNQRGITSTVVYDENYVGHSTYVNIENTYDYWANFRYSKDYRLTDKDKLTFSGNVRFNGGLQKGFQNGLLYSTNRTSWQPEVTLTFDFDKKLIIKPNYGYEIVNNSFENSFVEKSNFFRHKAGLMVTSYWPKNVVFGTDMNYEYNSNLSSDFRKDFLLWNVSIGYNFFDERFLAKVKVYDVLNQNQSIRRSVSPTSISDMENIILKQYFMFSLTYKLEKFAGKRKGKGSSFFD